jgi:hypothetical protein
MSPAVVVHEVQPIVEDVQRVPGGLIAVRDEHAPVARRELDGGADDERAEPDELERAPTLERGRAVGDGDRVAEHRAARRAHEVLDAGALVEGVHLVPPGLPLPALGQVAHPIGVLGGEVAQLGWVLGEVVELPLLVGEGGHGAMPGDDLPAVAEVAPVADHLEELLGPRGGCVRVGEGRPEAGALGGPQGVASPLGGCVDAGELGARRQEVADVRAVGADRPGRWPQEPTLRAKTR